MGRRQLVLVLMVLGAAACGDSSAVPTQPSAAAPEIGPGALAATVRQSATENVYSVTVAAREQGGQSSAILRTVIVDMRAGQESVSRATIEDAWPVNRLAPAATMATRMLTVRDDRPVRALADRATVTVTWVAERGSTSGSFTASVNVTQP